MMSLSQFLISLLLLSIITPTTTATSSSSDSDSTSYFSSWSSTWINSVTPETVSKFLKNIGQAFSDFIPCSYTCPNQGYPIPKSGYTPPVNGCGTGGMWFTKELARLIPSVDTCCSQHDFCYGTCNTARNQCDNKFRQCLKDVCAMAKELGRVVKTTTDIKGMCVAAANGLYVAVTSAGCPAYLQAQKEACVCVGKQEM